MEQIVRHHFPTIIQWFISPNIRQNPPPEKKVLQFYMITNHSSTIQPDYDYSYELNKLTFFFIKAHSVAHMKQREWIKPTNTKWKRWTILKYAESERTCESHTQTGNNQHWQQKHLNILYICTLFIFNKCLYLRTMSFFQIKGEQLIRTFAQKSCR